MAERQRSIGAVLPVGAQVTPRSFRTKTPRKLGARPTLLFKRYCDMRQRAHGRGTRTPWCYPEGWPWQSFTEFRTWALASGFSKINNSPDRPRAHEPYGPSNVVWKPIKANHATSRGRNYYGAQPDGPEPPECTL